MDKNAIKKYAIWARNELIARIAQRALRYGISKDSIVDAYADSIDGVLLSTVEKRQRQALIAQIEAKGFEQVVEEVAYTWFNRFCALRFMEVNGYLPSNIRVLSDEENNFKPEILNKAIELEFESINMETVYAFKEANKDEELYRYLLIVQCNELNKILPHMFQKLEDYTELLLPDNLLRDGSVIEQLVTTIPQEDFDINQGGQVEIIGWLYQDYITEPKDKLINARKQYKDEDIPFVTQLFTSTWIVNYMVENTLGRIWISGHPNDELKSKWKYYLEEAEQEPDVVAKLAKIRAVYVNLNPKDIKVIDPCMGSGHILVYAFDVLMQIYTSVGYTEKEAAISILENNLYGLDIDDRAFQLAYFAVMMKARQYHKFIFKKKVQCNIHSIVESNDVNAEHLQYFGAQLDELNKNVALTQMQGLLHQMYDAREYGSLITVVNYDWVLLQEFVDEFDTNNGLNLFNTNGIEETQSFLCELIAVGKVLAQEYEVVVTNPPYMNASYMPNKLKQYVIENYQNTKSDLYAAFIKRNIDFSITYGHIGMLTPYVWMFISSYEQLRKLIINHTDITSLVQLEYNAFESACVPVATFTFCNMNTNFRGEYIKLSEFKGCEIQSPKTLEAIYNKDCGYRYTASKENFIRVPGSPIAYWVSEKCFNIFSMNSLLGSKLPVKKGMDTGKNEYFLRKWYEIEIVKFSEFNYEKYWIPYCKGGEFRKWYGNNEYVLKWKYDGTELINSNANLRSKNLYFKEMITWSALSSSNTSFRYNDKKGAFDSAGSSMFPLEKDIFVILALMNSKIVTSILKVINPTLNYGAGSIAQVPVCNFTTTKYEILNQISKNNVLLSREDWDSFETSWDFKKHPLV